MKLQVSEESPRTAFQSGHSLTEELRSLVSEISRCRLRRIKPFTKLREELGIDSFTGLEILVAIEQRYDLKVTEAEANHVVTFQDMVKLIERRLQDRR